VREARQQPREKDHNLCSQRFFRLHSHPISETAQAFIYFIIRFLKDEKTVLRSYIQIANREDLT